MKRSHVVRGPRQPSGPSVNPRHGIDTVGRTLTRATQQACATDTRRNPLAWWTSEMAWAARHVPGWAGSFARGGRTPEDRAPKRPHLERLDRVTEKPTEQ